MPATEQHAPLAKSYFDQLARWIEFATRTERLTDFAAVSHAASVAE